MDGHLRGFKLDVLDALPLFNALVVGAVQLGLR